jgi:hypothetical protein
MISGQSTASKLHDPDSSAGQSEPAGGGYQIPEAETIPFFPSGVCCTVTYATLTGGRMNRTVARLNIEHYRKLLTEPMDETRRQTILRLLAEEEAKLATLSDPPPHEKLGRS